MHWKPGFDTFEHCMCIDRFHRGHVGGQNNEISIILCKRFLSFLTVNMAALKNIYYHV